MFDCVYQATRLQRAASKANYMTLTSSLALVFSLRRLLVRIRACLPPLVSAQHRQPQVPKNYYPPLYLNCTTLEVITLNYPGFKVPDSDDKIDQYKSCLVNYSVSWRHEEAVRFCLYALVLE